MISDCPPAAVQRDKSRVVVKGVFVTLPSCCCALKVPSRPATVSYPIGYNRLFNTQQLDIRDAPS